MPISVTAGTMNRNYCDGWLPNDSFTRTNETWEPNASYKRVWFNQFPSHRFAKGYKENVCKNVSQCILTHWISEALWWSLPVNNPVRLTQCQLDPTRFTRGFTGVFEGLTLTGRVPKIIPLQFRAKMAPSAWTNSTKAILVECTLSPRSLNRETSPQSPSKKFFTSNWVTYMTKRQMMSWSI